MPEMHLRQTKLICSTCGQFTKNIKKVTGDSIIYVYQNELKKPTFSMILKKITLQICQEEHFLIKHCTIKLLKLLVNQIMMNVKEVFLQWFTNFLLKDPYSDK